MLDSYYCTKNIILLNLVLQSTNGGHTTINWIRYYFEQDLVVFVNNKNEE
jgi:hypothetical protein